MPFIKDTNKTFIEKAIKRWGSRYDYSLVHYVNSRTPVMIMCKKHKKSFKQTPKSHFATKRHCCPLCYKEVAGSYQNEWRLKKKESLETFDELNPVIQTVFCQSDY